MNKKVIVVSLVSAAIFGIAGIVVYNSSFITTSDAVVESDFIAVQTENSGKVKEIFVKPDQNVTKGQVIAEIEVVETIPMPQVNKNNGSEVAAASSKAKLNEAEEHYKNSALMYKDGVILQEEYDRSLNKLTKAQGDYEKAQENSKNNLNQPKPLVKTNVTTSKVYAPKDGTVSLSYVNKGETAQKDKAVVLLDSNKPRVTAYFLPKYSENLKKGEEVSIYLKKYPMKSFAGIINSIGSEPEMSTAIQSLVIPVQIIFKDELNGYNIKQGEPVLVKLKK